MFLLCSALECRAIAGSVKTEMVDEERKEREKRENEEKKSRENPASAYEEKSGDVGAARAVVVEGRRDLLTNPSNTASQGEARKETEKEEKERKAKEEDDIRTGRNLDALERVIAAVEKAVAKEVVTVDDDPEVIVAKKRAAKRIRHAKRRVDAAGKGVVPKGAGGVGGKVAEESEDSEAEDAGKKDGGSETGGEASSPSWESTKLSDVLTSASSAKPKGGSAGATKSTPAASSSSAPPTQGAMSGVVEGHGVEKDAERNENDHPPNLIIPVVFNSKTLEDIKKVLPEDGEDDFFAGCAPLVFFSEKKGFDPASIPALFEQVKEVFDDGACLIVLCDGTKSELDWEAHFLDQEGLSLTASIMWYEEYGDNMTFQKILIYSYPEFPIVQIEKEKKERVFKPFVTGFPHETPGTFGFSPGLVAELLQTYFAIEYEDNTYFLIDLNSCSTALAESMYMLQPEERCATFTLCTRVEKEQLKRVWLQREYEIVQQKRDEKRASEKEKSAVDAEASGSADLPSPKSPPKASRPRKVVEDEEEVEETQDPTFVAEEEETGRDGFKRQAKTAGLESVKKRKMDDKKTKEAEKEEDKERETRPYVVVEAPKVGEGEKVVVGGLKRKLPEGQAVVGTPSKASPAKKAKTT